MDSRSVSLHLAALENNLEYLKQIIASHTEEEAHFLIHEKCRRGYTPLHYACAAGALDCVVYLVEHGAQLTATTRKERTPFHFAARSGNVEIVKHFLSLCDWEELLSFHDLEGQLPIHFAARSGNWNLLQFLVQMSPSLASKTTKHGMNTIHIASEEGDLEMTKQLLREFQGEPGSKFPPDAEGNTLLHFAAYSGNLDLYRFVEEYYEREQITVTRNASGHHPIFQAAISGNLELIKYIVDGRTELVHEESVSSNTPLFSAVKSGNVASVTYLLELFDDHKFVDIQGRNLFHHAASSGSVQLLEYLENAFDDSKELMTQLTTESHQSILHYAVVSPGVAPDDTLIRWLLQQSKFAEDFRTTLLSHLDREGRSLLHTACQVGNLAALDFLITNYRDRFDLEADCKRKSHLVLAASNQFTDIVSYLLNVEDVAKCPGVHKNILNHMGYCENAAILEQVVARLRVDVNMEDTRGHTALHFAALQGNFTAFSTLLSLDANINSESKEGVTMLHSAAYGGNLDIVRMLVEKYHSDPNTTILRGDGSTPLHYATLNLHEGVVKYLLERKANVNAVTVHQVSVLHDACKNTHDLNLQKQKAVVEMLLQAGAWKSLRVEASNGFGDRQTPYDMASNSSICKLLAARDPSFSADHILIPFKSLKSFFTDENILGTGNFGSVYRGNLFGTTVAIKRLQSKRCNTDYRFRLEVGIMAMIRHPNVCMLMGASIEQNGYCLVMEYIPTTLDALLKTEGIGFQEIINVALDICRGMAWLHTREPMILHCDLKADNILIDNGRAKVSDFGLSTLFDPETKLLMMERGKQEFHQATTAPEVAHEQKYSIRSDIYSFGCCFFAMYTNGVAFSGETVSFLHRHTGKSFLSEMITKCCSYYPDSRYDNFQEIICKLEDMKDNPTLYDAEHKYREEILEHVEMVKTEGTPAGLRDSSGSMGGGDYVEM